MIHVQNVALVKSRPSSKLEHLGKKTRSTGQIELNLDNATGHIFEAIIMNHAHNVFIDDF